MKVLWHTPHTSIANAGATILAGYKYAFEDLGHEFKLWTSSENGKELIEGYKPDIVIMSLTHYTLKYLNTENIKRAKKKGAVIFVQIPAWASPFNKLRINETPSIKDSKPLRNFISSGLGDIYFNVIEQGDPRMEGFAKETGYKYHTIPLAADKRLIDSTYKDRFKADISYIGTNLPGKRRFFKNIVFPLKRSYDVKLYGQDWTLQDKLIGLVDKAGKFFNIPYIKNIRKLPLQREDEGHIYASSIVSINVHEEYQNRYGNDCNERTFKIPLSGGFEITDNPKCVLKYFKEDEIVIARNRKEWLEKLEYYINNPEKRIPIIQKGRNRVLKDHTYHNRVNLMLKLSKNANEFAKQKV